jgi:hypothetical protein
MAKDRSYDRRSTTFVVRFVIVSMIPAFVGFVIAFSDESVYLGLGMCAGVVMVDVVMMLIVRRTRGARNGGPQRESDAVRSSFSSHVALLAVVGVVLSAVSVGVQLDYAGSTELRLGTAVMGGLLLLAAGCLALWRSHRS